MSTPEPSPPPAAAGVFGPRLPLAVRYAGLLATDGIDHGLIGPREVPRLWERHLLNCAAVARALPVTLDDGENRLVDVGSGAGLPGLVLALCRPDLNVQLVEPMQRRCLFLSDAVDALGLSQQVQVVRGRADDASVVNLVGGAPWVSARAVAPLDRLARWCLPLLRPGGQLLALKGASAEGELADHRAAVLAAGASTAIVETFAVSDEAGALSTGADQDVVRVVRITCGDRSPSGRRRRADRTRSGRMG